MGDLGKTATDPDQQRALPRSTFFVGRERELAELSGGLSEAVGGHGGLFLIVGEAGIGKTRLAAELGDFASRRGARVLWEGRGVRRWNPRVPISWTF